MSKNEILIELETLLVKIKNDSFQREASIKIFQDKIWNSELDGISEDTVALLKDLAIDLDYFEADEDVRQEDPSYYGPEKLFKEVASVLEKIR